MLLKYIIKIKNFYSFNQLAALLLVLFEREKISLSINEQEMSLKKTNGVRLKKWRKYNTRLGTCT